LTDESNEEEFNVTATIYGAFDLKTLDWFSDAAANGDQYRVDDDLDHADEEPDEDENDLDDEDAKEDDEDDLDEDFDDDFDDDAEEDEDDSEDEPE
jgi:hypothetical protein